jgi:hypothetical protein
MMFSGGFKKGMQVRILNDIGKELADDRIGTIEKVDGAYIYIKLDKSKAVVERYPNEITEIWNVSTTDFDARNPGEPDPDEQPFVVRRKQ